jgi:Tfp pilus assembly ATPase PilU
MQTFDQHLMRLIDEGLVSMEEAMHMASRQADFRVKAQNAGMDVVDLRV